MYLLVPVGFCLLAFIPLVTTVARFARGLKLGQRMGLVSGGSWALAYLIMTFGTRNLADTYGIQKVMYGSLTGIVLSIMIGVLIIYKMKRNTTTIQE